MALSLQVDIGLQMMAAKLRTGSFRGGLNMSGSCRADDEPKRDRGDEWFHNTPPRLEP